MGTMSRTPICIATAAMIATAAGSAKSHAQDAAYRWDAGAMAGMSGYLGDANSSNLYGNPGFAGAVTLGYLIDPRWTIRGIAGVASLSGNSADMTNVYPGGETYRFKSTDIQIQARAEFNFFNYGIGETYRRLRRWSPYLGLGIGLNIASCEGTHTAFELPLTVGVRYKISPRINLTACCNFSKVFGDNVDGPQLSDLNQIKSSFAKNTDWVSTLTVGFTYEFGERCKSCFYVD